MCVRSNERDYTGTATWVLARLIEQYEPDSLYFAEYLGIGNERVRSILTCKAQFVGLDTTSKIIDAMDLEDGFMPLDDLVPIIPAPGRVNAMKMADDYLEAKLGTGAMCPVCEEKLGITSEPTGPGIPWPKWLQERIADELEVKRAAVLGPATKEQLAYREAERDRRRARYYKPAGKPKSKV